MAAGRTHTLSVEIEAGGISTIELFDFNLPKPGWVIDSQPLARQTSAGVNVAFGNLLLFQTDVALPGLTLTRSFNSLDDDGNGSSRPFGRGWVIDAGPDLETAASTTPGQGSTRTFSSSAPPATSPASTSA